MENKPDIKLFTTHEIVENDAYGAPKEEYCTKESIDKLIAYYEDREKAIKESILASTDVIIGLINEDDLDLRDFMNDLITEVKGIKKRFD